jgi:hypothetical protein
MRQAREFSETAIKEALIPLGAYLGEVVLCGSWVPFVYRRWMLGKREGQGTVRTLDIDLAAPSPLPLRGRPLADQLRGAGYRVMRRPERPLWDLEGDAGPQVTHFERPDAPYLELITAHRGTGPQGGVREIQEGVGAAELEHVDILLADPRLVPIPGTSMAVRVPSPAAYVFQKGLTFTKRQGPEKKAKDLANLFDVLHNFPELHDGTLAGTKSLAGRSGKALRDAFRANLESAFASADAEGVRLVEAQQPHPYGEFVRRDVTHGPRQFRELVVSRFKELLEALGPGGTMPA